MCFVWISEKTAIISLYSINLSVFVTEAECLLRGTNWVFKSVSYSFVLKGLTDRTEDVLTAGDSCWNRLYETFNKAEQIKLNTTPIHVPKHSAIYFYPNKDQCWLVFA